MNRSFDNIEGEDDPCIETESVKVQIVFESNRAFDKIEVEDGPSIESETATAATLATQHMCESDSKSST
jgi:ribosome biogenesis SPOUT family RNA methylase Rps3